VSNGAGVKQHLLIAFGDPQVNSPARVTGPPNCRTENLAPTRRQHSPNCALCNHCTDFGAANLRIFRDNFGERDFYGKTMDCMADQVGFELAVRLAKFAFEISTEFGAPVAKLAVRENFAPEVLDENIRLVSAIRFRSRRCSIRSNEAAMHASPRSANEPKRTSAASAYKKRSGMDQRTVVHLLDDEVSDVGSTDNPEPPVLGRSQDAVTASC
jgi:hypothetical protein